MNRILLPLAVAAVSALIPAFASASAVMLGPGQTTYSENFDGMPTAGVTPLTPTPGFVNGLPGTSFDGTNLQAGSGSLNLRADNGAANNGALYSYGISGMSDRALGTVASGTIVPAFGVVITNNTGGDFSSFSLGFDMEQWRSSTSVQNLITFAYAIGSGGAITPANDLNAAGFTADPTFNLVGAAPVAGTNGPLDGNADAVHVSGTVNVTLAAGQSLFLRWTDKNDGGSDAGLAIDNFSFRGTSSAVPEPQSLALAGMGLAGLLAFARRRLGA